MNLREIRLKFRTGAWLEAAFTEDGEANGLRWRLSDSGERFALTLDASEETELEVVRAEFSYLFGRKDMLFLNGYQSWTDSREHSVNGRMHDVSGLPSALLDRYAFDRYGDYNFVKYGKRRGELHGFSYAYIRRGTQFELFGSLAEESGFTVIRFDTNRNTVVLEKDCRGHHFTGVYPVFDLAVLRGDEEDVFDRYFALLGTPRPRGGRIRGYTSWYNLYENISEASVEADLAGFAAAETPPDVFQIDDGYETAVGDWLSVDPVKFPHGLKPLTEKIRGAGMTAGLWLAPFAAEKDSALVREHPDWLLRDAEGEPVVGGSNWSGFYGLDIYNEAFRAYLREVFDTVTGEWGFRFVKLDFLYAACIVPRRDKTRARVMFDAMRLLRELCGDAWILGCGVPLAPAFGLVDYCRIGCDVSLTWNDEIYMRLMHRERISTKHSVMNTIYRRELDGRAFRNDPDVFLLREDNLGLTAGQKRILATVNALFGGVLFTSDDVSKYTGDSRRVYEEISALERTDCLGVDYANRVVTVTYRLNGRIERLHIPT
ncbi:MAG: alpha-galactosidase [Oscillospiraceae bacterium]|nr:alpha-galactosidase [Oscillospiraceae bacterium]